MTQTLWPLFMLAWMLAISTPDCAFCRLGRWCCISCRLLFLHVCAIIVCIGAATCAQQHVRVQRRMNNILFICVACATRSWKLTETSSFGVASEGNFCGELLNDMVVWPFA
jgi:hypothetical protein